MAKFNINIFNLTKRLRLMASCKLKNQKIGSTTWPWFNYPMVLVPTSLRSRHDCVTEIKKEKEVRTCMIIEQPTKKSKREKNVKLNCISLQESNYKVWKKLNNFFSQAELGNERTFCKKIN